MKTPKLKIKKIKYFLKKIPRVLALNSFLTLLGLIVIALFLSGLIFYKYTFSISKIEIKITEKPLQFEEKTCQNILKTWQEREERFKASSIKQYSNPFYSKPLTK